MKIIKYQYSDGIDGDWDYSEISLGKINLFVGESGSGKTKLLNTIFNIGSRIANESPDIRGDWKSEFQIGADQYSWDYQNTTNAGIEKEIITKGIGEHKKVLVRREKGKFLFNDKEMPKLSSKTSAICLLKEEPDIQPIFDGFKKIIRRNFFSDELERAAAFGNIPGDMLEKLEKNKDISLLTPDVPLNVRLYLLNKIFPDKYRQICDYFKSIFTSIESCDLPDASTIFPSMKLGLPGKIPVFAVKERGVKKLIGVNNLSSGMQKVLLLLTDIMTLSGDYLYLLDEYENSLGINAINFFPDFLIQHGENNQFIITTHHPYLINNMPIKDWYVFHRSGSKVTIQHGKQLEERLGKSKQKAFVQLINDPFYTEGK